MDLVPTKLLPDTIDLNPVTFKYAIGSMPEIPEVSETPEPEVPEVNEE